VSAARHPFLALSLDAGNAVRRPASVEAERDPNRQPDRRDRVAGEVLRIEDDDVTEVALWVVDVGKERIQPSSSAVPPGLRTNTGSAVIRPKP
jgi:hypothetical protein